MFVCIDQIVELDCCSRFEHIDCRRGLLYSHSPLEHNGTTWIHLFLQFLIESMLILYNVSHYSVAKTGSRCEEKLSLNKRLHRTNPSSTVIHLWNIGTSLEHLEGIIIQMMKNRCLWGSNVIFVFVQVKSYEIAVLQASYSEKTTCWTEICFLLSNVNA